MTDHVLHVSEEQRQLLLLALAHLSLEHPGFDFALNELALKADNNVGDRAEMYDGFRALRHRSPVLTKERAREIGLEAMSPAPGRIPDRIVDQVQEAIFKAAAGDFGHPASSGAAAAVAVHTYEHILLGRAYLGVDLTKPFPPFVLTVSGEAAAEAHEGLAAFMKGVRVHVDPATAPKPLDQPAWAGVHDIDARFHRMIIGTGKPPVKVGFDIGGVLSKYPDVLRPLVIALVEAEGFEVHVLSDMHPHAKCVEWVHKNGFPVVPERIHSCDYDEHGDGCKAAKAREIGLDVLMDDHLGYVAVPGAPRLRLLVMPDATEDYYHPTWQTDGSEGNFGRRLLAREVKQLCAVLDALHESGPVTAAGVLADWTEIDAEVDAGATSREDALALVRRHFQTLHRKDMVVRREEEGIAEWKAAVGAENLEAGATYELTVMAMTRIAQEGTLALAASIIREGT